MKTPILIRKSRSFGGARVRLTEHSDTIYRSSVPNVDANRVCERHLHEKTVKQQQQQNTTRQSALSNLNVQKDRNVSCKGGPVSSFEARDTRELLEYEFHACPRVSRVGQAVRR